MKLSDASWIVPLLQAVIEGKELQVYTEHTEKWITINDGRLHFDAGKECYRIKPEVVKYKRYLGSWCGDHRIGMVYSPDFCKEVERADNFIRWIDTEWQEVEV